MNNSQLIFHKQFGFRNDQSTDHALIELINSIMIHSVKINIC